MERLYHPRWDQSRSTKIRIFLVVKCLCTGDKIGKSSQLLKSFQLGIVLRQKSRLSWASLSNISPESDKQARKFIRRGIFIYVRWRTHVFQYPLTFFWGKKNITINAVKTEVKRFIRKIHRLEYWALALILYLKWGQDRNGTECEQIKKILYEPRVRWAWGDFTANNWTYNISYCHNRTLQ